VLAERRRRRALDERHGVKVAIADYGAGNVRSLCAALERAGATPRVTREPRDVLHAPLALVAGVGHLGSASRTLAAHGLDDALRERVAGSRPLLGICVGMQLLFEESEEGGRGLGLLRGDVRRLRARRVPHMGWNSLNVSGGVLLEEFDGDDVYFAHSYACEPAEPVTVARAEHDGEVVAAVEQGALAGVQFHPERSGRVGGAFLRKVLAWSRSA
jgi:glutamine amidotransferase